MRKIWLLTLCAIVLSLPLLAQNNFFTQRSESEIPAVAGRRSVDIGKFQAYSLNVPGIRNFLLSLPSEFAFASKGQAPVMELPMPDGQLAKFRVWESTIMEPALAAKYPEIKTFGGQGIDDPLATLRMDFNPYFGFSAQILTPTGSIYIDPYIKGNLAFSISYFTRDHKRENLDLICNTIADLPAVTAAREMAGACRGTQLYTYRLALACTGEYAVRVCSPAAATVAATMAAMTTSVNRVNGLYQSELAIRLVLIANNNLLVNLNASTDGYTNNNGDAMLDENQTKVDNLIGTDNYDIGHVFSTGGGGIAGLGVVCEGGRKANGVTGLPDPIGDDFDIDFVAHEMGHQFNATHTFNATTSNCGSGNRTASTAYEVGGGTTIMGYAGICTTNDVQPHSDAFFHTISFDQISTYIEGDGSCRTTSATGNTLPQIISMDNNNVTIPIGTPFTLTGKATDADNDPLTYCWEEWDLGPSGNWNSGATSTTAPLFKSRIPTTSGSRTFPSMAVILAGYPANPAATMGGLKGETLPTVARAMKFRLTVRDNRASGGGVVTGGEGCQSGFISTFTVNVANTGTPFAVTAPNGGESFPGGSNQTVTWNVSGSNAAPINCANVKISLSTDGGLTYPTVIIASTPNDGSQLVTMPNVVSTTARIKVEAVGNIFFDISNANFTLTASSPGFDFDDPGVINVACAGPASAVATLGTISVLSYVTPITLSATGVPSGATVTFAPNPVVPGNNATVTLNNTNLLSSGSYTITVTGVSGSITHTRDVVFNVQTGTGPTVSLHPQPQQACSGGNVTFTANATGALSYQWQVSTNGGTSFSNIAGAITSTFSITGVATSLNNNQYRVLAVGQCNSTTSNAATLTVLASPAINTQPQSTTLCVTSNATFTVAATGLNITYQWEVSTNGGTSYTPIGGATTSSLTVNTITTAMNNNRYRVVVSGTCTPSITSDPAILTVISPVAITANPQPVTVCETFDAVFTVTGNSSVPINYQWQVSTNGGAIYSVIMGANTPTLTVSSVTASMNGNLYRAVLSNATCTTPVPSTAALLTVNQRPTITLSASPFTSILPGQTTTISATITPSATGFNIAWLRNNVVIPGVTGTSYVVDSVEVGDYLVTILNPTTGCANTSNVITITTSASERLFIFPSPNNGQFTISYFNSAGTTTQQTVAVYDVRGALIYNAKLPIQGPYTLQNINLRGIAKGVYLVVVGDANGKRLARERVVVN